LVKFLEDKQIEKFAEIGTGRVLTSLLKRTAKELGKTAEVINIQSLENL
jgi:malonyl CoA-acyl carrier protein transacylase